MRVRIVFDDGVREDDPIYVISRAAELAGMHPQTLRQYDRMGLVSPRRTIGRGRRYSQRDILKLVKISELSGEEGINLAGIRRILDLEEHVRALEERVELLNAQANPGSRIFAAGRGGDVVKMRGLSLREARIAAQRAAARGAQRNQLSRRDPEHRLRISMPLQITAHREDLSDSEETDR